MSTHRTALHETHRRLGARMVEFNGWEMPVQYSSITEEHLATRQHAGLFDLSHMGRIELAGKDRAGFLSRITTARTSTMPVGKGRYSFLCTPEGGVIDDIVVYRFKAFIGLVVNAGNREAVLEWLEEHRGGDDVEIRDRTFELGMIALQGPRSEPILQGLIDVPLGELPYYRARRADLAGIACIVSRTGYTGEDGFEIFVPTERSESTWGLLHEAGVRHGILPAGLGARDTLRLEAAMPLYGHELSRDVNPLEAGLGKFVHLEKEFIGCEALRKAKREGTRRRLVGLEVGGKRIPRQGASVHVNGDRVGEVTSGTFSPSLKKTIALAYVEREMPVGSSGEVDVRGKRHGVAATEIPFYRRER